MNDLAEKLKYEVVNKLMKNEQLVGELCLVQGKKSFTRREIANEIKENSEWGITFLGNILMLAIEIMASEKE